MGGLPIAFGAPAVLFGLIALPVIWWLLRLTPPRPQTEPFAPLAILARVLKREETPSHSPWWLTLLRLLVAAFVILALSEPQFNPRERGIATGGPLVLFVDNGWASAPDWDTRIEAARLLVTDARDAGVPVSVVFTADRRHDATPGDAQRALDLLSAARPRPAKPERGAAVTALAAALGTTAPGTIAFLTDGIATPDGAEALTRLLDLSPADLQLMEDAAVSPVALTASVNNAEALEVAASRLPAPDARRLTIVARDARGRDIARGEVTFETGNGAGGGTIATPFEIRNDIARIDVAEGLTAGGTRLVDDSFRRRRVAVISGETADLALPLLSPLNYIWKALMPYVDLVAAESSDLAKAIPELIAHRPAVIIMADIGTLPEAETQALDEWVRKGGTLVRFAGPRLAANAGDDPLVPVRLRQGERELGGALSWAEPQPLAAYPATSPFAGLPVPAGVTVRRQVLAEPSADLAEKTWAGLADGTPLVTASIHGEGRLVLFHVTAEAGWSDLPISGHFVDMLRRIVQLSRAAGGGTETANAVLPPWRLLDADGALVPATGEARPLDLSGGKTPRAGPDNPPGLYGTEDGYVALNLFRPEETLEPLVLPETAVPVARVPIGPGQEVDFRPWLFAAALAGLLIDTLIVLAPSMMRRLRRRTAAAAAALALVLAAGLLAQPPSAQAQDVQPGDVDILDKLDVTHLAYVMTGDDAVDSVSEAGLRGLSRRLASRTALEPGEPVGLDIETDQLAFYPLIYWAVSANGPMPSQAAISRIDAYMKNGGTVLFDTRDRMNDLGGGTTPETERLQAILANLDIPPLEPVPADHVLTKAFYLLDGFPGRYADGQLWIEASFEQAQDPSRPARSGDGVSTILITGNDFATAWAEDADGNSLYPTVPNDPWQREYAYRAGVNIMMYMLTGNYKSDQVHVPALLERLGQ